MHRSKHRQWIIGGRQIDGGWVDDKKIEGQRDGGREDRWTDR